jgi:hypothetical protein
MKNHAVKAYGKGDVWFHAFLISGLNGGEWYLHVLTTLLPEEQLLVHLE